MIVYSPNFLCCCAVCDHIAMLALAAVYVNSLNKIKIADAVPGVDKRVIIISAPERDRAHGRDHERGRDREGREKERASRERDGGRE